jgi:hypothetical protein
VIAGIARMLFQEFLLLLDCLIEIVENKSQRVLIHHLCPAISGQNFLHDLVQEVVTEMSHGDSATFLDQILSHTQKAPTLEKAKYEISFEDSDHDEELDD